MSGVHLRESELCFFFFLLIYIQFIFDPTVIVIYRFEQIVPFTIHRSMLLFMFFEMHKYP